MAVISLARGGPVEAATDPSKFNQAIAHFVQPGYFEFAKTPVIAGRSFTEADNRPNIKAIIIDDLMAAQLFPNGNQQRGHDPPGECSGRAVGHADETKSLVGDD